MLKQLPRHLPADLVCVLFDLQGQAALPLESLLYGLAREIAGRCNLPRPARDQIHADSFADFLAGVAATLGSPRRLVLLFDEFDVVDVGVGTNTAASRFLGYLAGLLERLPELGVVLVVGRKIAELSEAFAGAILRNAVQHRLVRLTRAQSDALATDLGAATLAFDASALQALYALAAGHPYCTQLLCNLVWQRCVRPGVVLPAAVVAAEVVAAVLPAVEYGTSGMSWIYDGLDVPSHRFFLAALAELQVPTDEAGLLQLARQANVGSVALTEIEQRLLRSGTQIDAAELRTAPARLANWDVVDGHRRLSLRRAADRAVDPPEPAAGRAGRPDPTGQPAGLALLRAWPRKASSRNSGTRRSACTSRPWRTTRRWSRPGWARAPVCARVMAKATWPAPSRPTSGRWPWMHRRRALRCCSCSPSRSTATAMTRTCRRPPTAAWSSSIRKAVLCRRPHGACNSWAGFAWASGATRTAPRCCSRRSGMQTGWHGSTPCELLGSRRRRSKSSRG
ncbi:MAG: hypothetical protein IPQ21_20240 [Betaproteobacteria bacterium]|nr:hypothetical protein [Betaproteobacteria bacterium]